MITYSGFVFFYTAYMPAGIVAVYGNDDQAEERYFADLYGAHTHEPVARPAASVPEIISHGQETWGPESQIRSVFIQHDAGEVPRVEIGRVRGERVRWFAGHTLGYNADSGEPLKPAPDQSMTVKTHQVLLALHEGRFAEPWLRWLYFLSGLMGAGMIGTGLVLWTVKRRRTHRVTGYRFGLRLVEALNAATIAGLPTGIAAYFWANRLLPVEMAERANWEANVLFLIWGEALIYAFFRHTRKAWVELLWLASAAYALLPLINAMTTDKHLGVTLPAGDWALVGFDLTMLVLGLAFAYMAIKVKRIWLGSAAQELDDNPRALAGGSE
ncbi:PepSY-associated TM helix domain-containing protein [Marinobacter oulmenensis]|uniref:Putative iron-regulated membrane protein n=1 Tax=Marinobacter oulmenensis TaxID=643747 RepID=A0A840U751_9GAMM|nr:PepSY-associated TM helix domain-containing protein [Marinobacter oulmenensis]MBB5320772.1 putative iron-regulated membrane protein [Marinobacter oulmenensis]